MFAAQELLPRTTRFPRNFQYSITFLFDYVNLQDERYEWQRSRKSGFLLLVKLWGSLQVALHFLWLWGCMVSVFGIYGEETGGSELSDSGIR